ncbi:MAG: HAMP domain-containing sensor histidine kinase [Myxococcota bacterium]
MLRPVLMPEPPSPRQSRTRADVVTPSFRDGRRPISGTRPHLRAVPTPPPPRPDAEDERLALAGHEMLNGLANVQLLKDLLVAQRGSKAEQAEVSDELDGAIARLAEVARALLVRGATEPAARCRDLPGRVRAAVERHRRAARQKGIVLSALLPEAFEARFERTLLGVAVDNLLSNALKFSKRGSFVQVVVERRGADVRIAVHDEGPGLAPDELAKVFAGRASARPTAGEASHGLGLGLVRGRLREHGADLRAESPGRGQGATFTIVLPGVTG